MAIRKVLRGDDTLLRRTSYPVKEFNQRLANIANDLRETMYVYKGVGLSAIQVGLRLRMCIVDTRDEKGLYLLINPEIIETMGTCTMPEGCLSVPNRMGEVTRPEKISVKFRDLQGRQGILAADGILARIIQHEIDHMDGILYTDIMDKELFEQPEEEI